MLNAERPQDFELIELLIKEGVIVTSSEEFKSFKARFQSYVDQMPSYLHSVNKEEFFPHFFFGGFSTLLDTQIGKKLDIDKIYFRFSEKETLKVAVIKKGKINDTNAADKIKLFSISKRGAKHQEFDSGNLDNILSKLNLSEMVRNKIRTKLEFKLVEIFKVDASNPVQVGVEAKKVTEQKTNLDFHEIKKGLWQNPENYIERLASVNPEIVERSTREILEEISKVYLEYKGSFFYEYRPQGTIKEAAHHGFVAGIFAMNFHYRYNLRVYLEQFAGRGYSDIILLARGKERSLNSVPIIIELKAGTATPNDGLEQAKSYAKGFQPNTMRVLTTSDNVLCVGLNLDSAENEKFLTYLSPPRDREPDLPTIQKLLEVSLGWDGRANTIKERIKQPLERIYYTFPGTPEKRGNYFSRFLLGQLIHADEFEGVNLRKSVFLYKEYPLNWKRRPGTSEPTGKPVTTFMLTTEDNDQQVFIFHIREGGRGERSDKKIPTDLPKVNKITEVYINVQEGAAPFNVEEIKRYNSVDQYKGGKEAFKGKLERVPYPNELKETFDRVLDSQRLPRPGQPAAINDQYQTLLRKIAEGIHPLQGFVKDESDFQGILHGAFSYYSDLKLQGVPETRALVLTEFQTGRGKRTDMLVHGIKFQDRGADAKKYVPIGLELKGPRDGVSIDALKKEANDQIEREYKKGVTYKTLTDGDEVKFIGVVFDKGANNAGPLILTSRTSKEGFISVEVDHSSVMVSQQTLAGCLRQTSRKKRSVSTCLFSKSDVEKFSRGRVDENNADKIVIDGEKFLTYIKNSQDERKNAQLIEFIGTKNIEGEYKYLVDKVIRDQGYERYIQNERIKDLRSDILQLDSGFKKDSKLKGRLMNAAGVILLIRGVHGTVVSCRDGTAIDCGLNIGGIGWSFASQPIENVMIKVAPKVVTSAERVAGKIIPGTLGKQTKFAIRIAGVKYGSTIAKGVAGALTGVLDIVDIGISTNNLIDCKKRENSDNPCEEKEIRDNIASISFSGVSFVSGVALTAVSMPVVGIAVGLGIMVGHGIYSGVSNIIEYKKKHDTTHEENWSIFWRTILFQDMASDVQHLADRKNTVDSLAKAVWKALNNAPNSVVAYGVGLGKVSNNTLRPDYAKILMDKEDTNTKDLSRVIPDSIPGASRICLPKVTGQDYEKGITSSVQPPLYYCENAMVISHDSKVGMKQSGKTIVYDLQNVDNGVIIGSNKWNNNFLIYPGTTKITGGNNVTNRFVIVNNPSFSGKMIGGSNSINILDLSQLAENKVTGVIDYRFKPNAYGRLKVRINNRLLIDDYVSNNLFNYHYIGRQNKVDEVLCMGYSEHFTESDNRDVIIDSGGGVSRNKKDVVKNCRKVIISPYTTVEGGKSNYTFYVKTADYKGRGLYSEINVDGTGTVVFPEIDLLSDCDQITYSTNSNTLSLKINFGQNNQFTLDVKNYVEQSSNKPHFVLIDKNGSNIVPKIERSDSATIKINSFELHSEHSLGNFKDVENHYKKILKDDKDYRVLSVIRDKIQSQDNSVVPYMVFGSSGDDVINFDQGTLFARGGKGSDVYVITDDINKKEVKIDNNSDDEKVDTLFIPEVEKDFSIQQCDLYLKYNNSNIRVKNYFQDRNHRHLIIMNKKGEAFIPIIESMSCSSSEEGKLVPFLQATQTQNMFLLSKDFEDDHVVIDSHLEDIEKYKDKDDLLLIREGEAPLIIIIEDFYNDQSKWRDINFLLWNNGNFSHLDLPQRIDEIVSYQDKLKDDYEKIVKEYIIGFSNSISIEHNQKSEGGILTSVGRDEERIGIMVLKSITPNQVEVLSRGTDLIFYDKVSNHTINIKNWDNYESYRISTLEFGLEPITIRRLDRFSLSEVRKIQDLIDKASENYQSRSTPEVENSLKCLISVNDLKKENEKSAYQCLGFSSLQEQVNFVENFCSLEQIEELKDKLNNTEMLALLRNLQNNILLNGYSQNVLDQCSESVLAKQQIIDEVPSMVKNVEGSGDLPPEITINPERFSNIPDNSELTGHSHRKKRHDNHFWNGEEGNVVVQRSNSQIECKNNITNIITSGYEELDIDNLPLQGVIIYDDFNRKKSLKSRLDLCQLVKQVYRDLNIKLIPVIIKEKNDVLIKLSISSAILQQDVMEVRLKDALVSSWYRKLEIIFNNAPMRIDDNLNLKPSLLISDQKNVIVRSQDVEKMSKLILSQKAGQYKFFHAGYDLIVTYGSDTESYVYLKDFYKETVMETLSIRFTDREILLHDEIEKIYNADSIIIKLYKSSDPSKVKQIPDNVNINVQDEFGKTPIFYAVQKGNRAEVELLLDRKAEIEIQDKLGRTPILCAAQEGKWSIVELLLNRGANIDNETTYQGTPLHFAVEEGNLGIVEFLLDRGADIESRDYSNRKPLHCAVDAGRLDAVKLLLNRGADIDAQDMEGQTSLDLATRKGYTNIAKVLKQAQLDKGLLIAIKNADLSKIADLVVQGADINTKDKNGKTPLHNAASKGSLNIVKYLIEKGAGLEVKDRDGRTPIYGASWDGHSDIVKYLVEKGVNVNVTDKDDWTPLHWAASIGNLEIVKFLVEKGANINAKNIYGKKPIHRAAEKNHRNIIEFFLNKGINVNDTDRDGRTSLYWASSNGHLDVVKYLVDKGANINARDKNGKTPLGIAIDRNHGSVVEYLQQVQLNLDKQLLPAVRDGNLSKVKDLVSRGASLDIQSENGLTLLHSAFIANCLNIAGYFIEKGADIDARDKDGNTSLHYVSRIGYLDAVKYLISKGADIDAKDNNGSTPLDRVSFGSNVGRVLIQAHLDRELLLTVGNKEDLKAINDLIVKDIGEREHGAFYDTWKGDFGTVKYLVERDVSVNATDKYDCTLLHWAALKGHSDIAKFLVDKGANVNAKDILGRTPIHFAVMNNHKDIQDVYGRDSTYTTAESNDEEIIELFLMKGASINEVDKNGEAPLHLASWGGHFGILQDLINNGANIGTKDSSGKTPLDIARDKGHNNLVQYLQQTQLTLDKQLLIAIRNSDLNKVRGLVAQGANIDTNDKNVNTLLYSAAEIGNLNLVKLLLDNGANIEAKNREYQATPLHGAVANSRIDIVKLLLNRGANVNVEDKDNWTPLHYGADTNSLDIVKVLVDAHANLGAKGNYGNTPLDIAKNKRHNNIVEYLEKKLREERGEPLQRKRRHHHGDHNSHNLSRKPLAIDQPQIATSSGAKLSSWINDLFGWVRSSVSGLLSSEPESTKSPVSQVDAKMDVNGTIMLLDVLVRKVTGQRYISTVDQPISPLEAQGYALNITKGFEKVVEQAGLKSGVSMHRLNIDYMGMQKEITGKVISGKFNEISGILKSYVEKACPGREAGKLSTKKFDKFIAQFNKGLINQSIEQILHNVDGTLEADGAKQMSLEPQSYLSNASIQSHSKDKVSTCLSDIGVTKLGNTLSK